MGAVDVTGADCCCLSRPSRDFTLLSERQVMYLLKMNQNGVITILCLQSVIFILWSLAIMIPGFALYDGAAGSVSSYTHAGFWMIPEFLIIVFGAVATYFGLNYSSTTRTIEKGVQRVVEWDTFYMVCLFINFCADVIHGSLALVELSTCTSTLCVSYKWVLITAIVLLFVLGFLSLLQILRIKVFQNNLCYALAAGKIDTSMSFKSKEEEEDEEDVVVVVQPPKEDYEAPPAAPADSENASAPQAVMQKKILTTPLLAQLNNGRHGFKAKQK